MAGKPCPQCGDTVADLLKIDAGLRLRLRETGEYSEAPPEVCTNCYKIMTSAISHGAQLRAKAMARDQQRMAMWRNRVQLLKQARAKVDEKALSEGAILYEKYLRVLEIIFEVGAGELKPDLFKSKSKEAEVSVVASVYWELLKIYDGSPRYGDRQQKTSEKLIEFAKAAGMLPKLAKQAEHHTKSSRNPDLFRGLAKDAKARRGRCFIATSAFNTYDCEEVAALMDFRDSFLERQALGRLFISAYYLWSPGAARWLDNHPELKPLARGVLGPISRLVSRI